MDGIVLTCDMYLATHVNKKNISCNKHLFYFILFYFGVQMDVISDTCTRYFTRL